MIPIYIDGIANVDEICIYFALFSLLWLITGLYNLHITNLFSSNWNKMEECY